MYLYIDSKVGQMQFLMYIYMPFGEKITRENVHIQCFVVIFT